MAKQKKSKRDRDFSNLLRKEKLDKSAILNHLSNYASDHSSFSFYAAIDDEKQYKDKKFYLFFGLPDRWEDKEDKEKYKKNISKDELCFVRCLSYQQTESIAMWHMYGLPNNVRITIKGSVLRNGLSLVNKRKDTLKAYLICKRNRIGEKFEINSSEIEKFDLLYYSLNKEDKQNSYFVQKDSDVVVKTVRNELISQLKDEFFLKRYAFASEVETRLQVKLNVDFLKKYLPQGISIDDICGLAVEPNFKKEDIEQIKIVRRPEILDVRNIMRKIPNDDMISYIGKDEYPKTMYAEGIPVGYSELD